MYRVMLARGENGPLMEYFSSQQVLCMLAIRNFSSTGSTGPTPFGPIQPLPLEVRRPRNVWLGDGSFTVFQTKT